MLKKGLLGLRSCDNKIIAIVLFLFSSIQNGIAQSISFERGADVSWCSEMEADGRVFRNADGVVTDIFALMKQIGMSAVRLRVWVNPVRFGYGAWSDKADVVAKAKRAHAQGLGVMIDFHYSDFFADPGTQTTPLDWQGYSTEQMKEALADHTKDVLQALKNEGIEPRWVQVGNETNSGMLWDSGRINWSRNGTARYQNYVAFSNAGYDAVKSVFPQAYVIIHLGGTENAVWFFTDFKAAGGKFDMIGLSHYPTSSEWNSAASSATHSNINAAKNVREAIEKFRVPVMICETGFDAWQPKLASEVMADFIYRMKEISQCAGVFYWEPQVDGQWKPAYYQNLGWGAYGKGAFTTDGRPTEILDAFGEGTSHIKGIADDQMGRYGTDQIVNYQVNPIYFDLQGRRHNVPTKGLMIVKQGQKSIKMLRK